MEITFTKKAEIDTKTFNINFEAVVDGVSVPCCITQDALDAIADKDEKLTETAQLATLDLMGQFNGSLQEIHALARKKIINNAGAGGEVVIYPGDVE